MVVSARNALHETSKCCLYEFNELNLLSVGSQLPPRTLNKYIRFKLWQMQVYRKLVSTILLVDRVIYKQGVVNRYNQQTVHLRSRMHIIASRLLTQATCMYTLLADHLIHWMNTGTCTRLTKLLQLKAAQNFKFMCHLQSVYEVCCFACCYGNKMASQCY